MDTDAKNQAQSWEALEEAVGGRVEGCPSNVVKLYRLAFAEASGEPPTDETRPLLDHIERCSVCRRTFQAALAVARNELAPERPKTSSVSAEAIAEAYPDQVAPLPSGSLLDELAERFAAAPVLKAFTDGSVRCLVGQYVLLSLLEPARAGSNWGQTCWVDFGTGPIDVHVAAAGHKRLEWERGRPVRLGIKRGDQVNEVCFPWEGWGEAIRFLAVAFYPGSPQTARQLLKDLDVSPLPFGSGSEKLWEELRRDLRKGGSGGRKAFRRLQEMAEHQLRAQLQTLQGLAPVSPKQIDDALRDTWVAVLRQWKSIPEDFPRWLLEEASACLRQVVRSNRAVSDKPAPTKEEPTGAAPPAGSGHLGRSTKGVQDKEADRVWKATTDQARA